MQRMERIAGGVNRSCEAGGAPPRGLDRWLRCGNGTSGRAPDRSAAVIFVRKRFFLSGICRRDGVYCLLSAAARGARKRTFGVRNEKSRFQNRPLPALALCALLPSATVCRGGRAGPDFTRCRSRAVDQFLDKFKLSPIPSAWAGTTRPAAKLLYNGDASSRGSMFKMPIAMVYPRPHRRLRSAGRHRGRLDGRSALRQAIVNSTTRRRRRCAPGSRGSLRVPRHDRALLRTRPETSRRIST
jgi:hypothetical protein